MSRCTCSTDKEVTCIVHPTDRSLKDRIQKLENRVEKWKRYWDEADRRGDLLEAQLAAERAVPEWRSCTDDPPPFDIPVFVRWKKWPDKMVSAVRVADSDGWFWAQHVGGYHADFLDPESYEFDDDYAYDEWHPMPMTALWPAAPGAGGGE